jgi:hypothetical protein
MVTRFVVLSLMVAAVAHADDSFRITVDPNAEGLRIFRAEVLSNAMSSHPSHDLPQFSMFGPRYPVHTVTSTVFAVGENAVEGGGIDNYRSAWDSRWLEHFASGLGQNPFYVALPVNDVTSDHSTKPEARSWIPWFREAFIREGQSVCKGRWVRIQKGNRTCYAQWEDCGPFRTDCWDYVFGRGIPDPNRNGNAGIDVSPAVRDYLNLQGIDQVSWKFCEFREVPPGGPWAMHGDNNTFVLLKSK